MQRRQGFTLIEIVIAIFILLLLLMLAVPSLTGVLADRRLRRSLDRVNNLVNQARERSVREHRPYLVVVNTKAIEVRPEVFAKGEAPASVAQLPLVRTESIKLTLPAALTKDPPAEWIFWPSGTSEPAIVQYIGRDGTWTANYSALSGRPELTKYAVR
jgi:prepilin-type N-terminal cleavage/methylation domain-containing protein